MAYIHVIGARYDNKGVRTPKPYIAVGEYICYSIYVNKLYFRFNGQIYLYKK